MTFDILNRGMTFDILNRGMTSDILNRGMTSDCVGVDCPTSVRKKVNDKTEAKDRLIFSPDAGGSKNTNVLSTITQVHGIIRLNT